MFCSISTMLIHSKLMRTVQRILHGLLQVTNDKHFSGARTSFKRWSMWAPTYIQYHSISFNIIQYHYIWANSIDSKPWIKGTYHDCPKIIVWPMLQPMWLWSNESWWVLLSVIHPEKKHHGTATESFWKMSFLVDIVIARFQIWSIYDI